MPAVPRSPTGPSDFRKPTWFTALAVLCLAIGTLSSRSQTAPEPFDYHGVALHDGPLLRQVLAVREEYLRVPNDDFLKPFRQRAGQTAPGTDLGGWYSDGTFHIFGQILSGLARMHAATGDPACRLKLHALIDGWKSCLDADGYFFPGRPPRPGHYIYEKMVGGLLDAHRYGGHPEALALLDRITTWAESHLDHSNHYIFDTLTGITEWYTLSENLYRAGRMTGQKRYRDFAQTWEYPRFWELFSAPGIPREADLFAKSRGYHAYSHVNSLNGALAAFGDRGNREYLHRVLNAYHYLQQEQVFATGGYGPGERLVPRTLLLDYLDTMENHWETACCSWAAFKLCKQLFAYSGEPTYGDWIERLIINGIGSALPMHADGRVMYYSRFGLGGAAKGYNHTFWSCCAGSRIQAVADYHDLIFFKAPDSLYINLYTPATVFWNHHGSTIVVRQNTRFPESEEVELHIDTPRPETFTLKFRPPSWLARPMEAQVNANPVSLDSDPKGWASLHRTWNPGDRVRLRLPMKWTLERFPKASPSPFPAALVRGPVVLACRAPHGNPVSRIDWEHLDATLVPSPGEPMTYHVAGASDLLFRPLHRFQEGERYFLYFDPKHPWTRRQPHELSLSPGWAPNLTDDFQTTTHVGAFAELTFRGSSIRWVGRKFDDAGRAEVRLDGKVLGIVDQYDPVRDTPFRHEINGLSDAEHTIRVTLLPDRHPSSKDRRLNIVGFDVLGPVQSAPGTAH